MTNDEKQIELQDDEIYDAAFSAYCRGETTRELFRLMWNTKLKCSIGWDKNELTSFAKNIAALYTTSPQREWQGLTDEEIRDLWSWSASPEAERTASTQQHAFARAIEAKLKEKNT